MQVSKVDPDLYKINGTNYHIATKRCFKEGFARDVQIKIWIDENKVDAKIQDNLFATSFGAELDRIKIHTFQQKLVFKEMTSNFILLSIEDKDSKTFNFDFNIDFNIILLGSIP